MVGRDDRGTGRDLRLRPDADPAVLLSMRALAAYPGLFIKVVVEIFAGSASAVQTAHLVGTIHAQDVRLWP